MNISALVSKIFQKIFQRPCVQGSNLHKTVKIQHSSNVYKSSIGKYTYVGTHTNISMCEIGSFTSISNYCALGGGAHAMDFVSTSPVFCEGRNPLRKNFASHTFKTHVKTVIGNDVWIGSNCMIKSGITIADGAVIGMGSVVTKDVGPYEIWAGNPAKLIKKRFDDETITKLLGSNWWEFSNSEIKNYAKYFNDPDTFTEIFEKRKF